MVWYSHLLKNFPQFIVIHTVKGFGIVNKAEIDVFLELSCFFDDPVDVGNLISGSSAFSKSSLNIWKFTVHVLLKPGLENFEHYFTRLVAQWCPTLCDSMHCSPPGFSVHGILQARILSPGVSCRSLFQGLFLTQGLNLGLLHGRQFLYLLSH